jgi:hypothetical protein
MSRSDWLSIAKGAGIAVAGALLAFGAEVLIPAMQSSGSAVLLGLAAVASVAINVARKWLVSHE